MLKYRIEFRRFNRSIWGAVALLALSGFLLQNVAGSVYYSLLMGPITTVSSAPVELQNGTAGTSTVYTNGTSALVSVAPSGGGIDVEDYVDNNSWDEDGIADKGTHSNFTAQQYGPDLINDTLTETSTASEWLNVNAYSATYEDWNPVGTSPYLDAQDQPTNYVYIATNFDAQRIGWFDFPNTTLTGNLYVNISIYCRNDDGVGEDFADVYVDYTGSGAGSDAGDVAQHTSWQYDTIDLGSHTVSEVNNLRVFFEYEHVGTGNDVCIDHVRVGLSVNCELDLEVQWTSVDYDESNEFLCIYGGTMGAENIRVDVWNGSGWENLFTDLNSGWNNVSVISYLTTSNFTIRFNGGSESGDTTQDTWNIDAVLLHIWTGNEVLSNATTVTSDAKTKSNSYGKDRAVLRTTDANNTLHVFQVDYTASAIFWWKSTDNGQTWSKQITSGLESCTSFSVKRDSSNYLHLVYRNSTDAGIYYRKQLYNSTSWASPVLIDSSSKYQPDVAVAPYNNNWVYVVYDYHTAGGSKHTEVWIKTSTNGGTSFGSAYELTYNEHTADYTAGTFPSIVIDNTLGTYGHIYVTWFRGDTNLYLRRGNITSDGTVSSWDSAQTISSSMSGASTIENTNMMHSAIYVNGKYRVVYCESGTAKYRDWSESSWSTPISIATVSHYPSITYDWNNYIYVFYQTDDLNDNYDIRYQKSYDTTPIFFGSPQNITNDNNGNRYVNTKLGGSNNRVEFVWTYATSDPYQVKYNCLDESSEDNFNYVLKAVEKDNSNWKVRFKAYAQSNISRLDNCTIYIYDGSNSTQIIILNGTYTQQTGPWYDLNASDTEYIWMHVETSSAGTSTVYVYLEILVPNTTIYARYIITFEIT